MPIFDCGIHRVQADGVSWFLDHAFDGIYIACRRNDYKHSRFLSDEDHFVCLIAQNKSQKRLFVPVA